MTDGLNSESFMTDGLMTESATTESYLTSPRLNKFFFVAEPMLLARNQLGAVASGIRADNSTMNIVEE